MKPEWIKDVYAQRPWDLGYEAILSIYKFEDPKKAWLNLTTLARHINFDDLFPQFFPELLKQISSSYQPDMALVNFERF